MNSSIVHFFFFFFFCFLTFLFVVFCNFDIRSHQDFAASSFSQTVKRKPLILADRSRIRSGGLERNGRRRKLLMHGRCSNRDISISQSKDLTSGIPQYIVQIANTCLSECAPSDIHLHCGWFASARIVNPRTFKRLSYDDCLVNGGKPLKTSETIRFTYSNSFMYPLRFKSAKFC